MRTLHGFTAVSCPIWVVWLMIASGSAVAAEPIPRFTEEREAAAIHFVKKQLPELKPLLDDLKKNHRTDYELEIREIFQVTEILADLQDEPKRYELELRIWKTENKALVAVARLASAKGDDKNKLESQLHDLAKELVDLDMQSMEAHRESLEKELQNTRDELARLRENHDKTVKDRFESLLEKVKKQKK